MVNLISQSLNFLDLETTGLRFHRDKIIEIYISKEYGGSTISTFHSLVNPGLVPDRFILELTNIPIEQLELAPSFEEIAEKLHTFLSDGLIVAHNARFDYSFLKYAFSEVGMVLNTDYCCTVKMARKLYPLLPNHKLDSIRTLVDDNFENKHRAEADTNVIKNFYYKVVDDFGISKVEETLKYSIKKSAIPTSLLSFDFNSIPEQSGVYIFYGKENYPLYVGMSNNLRRRVRDHLYSDTSYSKDFVINQQLDRIETIPTAGVLGAALRESYLVKKLEPIYNRKLRRVKQMAVAHVEKSESEYKTIQISSQAMQNKEDLLNAVLITSNLRSIKEKLTNIAKEFGLCPILLGLEKGTSACFSYQLGFCKGACCDKISPDEYNSLFNKAFKNLKIKDWKFKTPILITETFENMTEKFLFDNWSFLGSSNGQGDISSLSKFIFNLDTYKILSNYLNGRDESSIQKVENLSLVDSEFRDLF